MDFSVFGKNTEENVQVAMLFIWCIPLVSALLGILLYNTFFVPRVGYPENIAPFAIIISNTYRFSMIMAFMSPVATVITCLIVRRFTTIKSNERSSLV